MTKLEARRWEALRRALPTAWAREALRWAREALRRAREAQRARRAPPPPPPRWARLRPPVPPVASPIPFDPSWDCRSRCAGRASSAPSSQAASGPPHWLGRAGRRCHPFGRAGSRWPAGRRRYRRLYRHRKRRRWLPREGSLWGIWRRWPQEGWRSWSLQQQVAARLWEAD